MQHQEQLLTIMAVFTGVAAVALVIQMLFLMGIFLAIRTLQKRSATFMDRWEPLADTANQTLTEVREQSTQILKKVDEIAKSTQQQVQKVGGIVDDVGQTTRTQLERFDRSLESAVSKMNASAEQLQAAVLMPVRQVRALAAALNAVLDHLFGGRRSSVDQATGDEEMFI